MPPTISDFRAIATGTHNVGDVLLDETTGGLRKVNNFVSRWRVSRNNTVSSPSENAAVRQALYNALMTDGRVSAPVMNAIRSQLLGENEVRALKRDEVAVYLAAADADDATGMVERIKELRDRTIRAAGDKPIALKSRSDVAMQLSANEKLDFARMRLQRARVDLERYMVAKKEGKPVSGLLDEFYSDFSGAFKGFALQDVPDGKKRAGWERAIELNVDILKVKIENGTAPCENHEQLSDVLWPLDNFSLFKYDAAKLRDVKATLRSAFANSIEGLAPSTVDVVRQTVAALGEDISFPGDDAADEAAESVAGRHFKSDNPRSAVAENVKAVLGAVAQKVKTAALEDPKFVRCGEAQKPSELMMRFFRQVKADISIETRAAGESKCVLALANAVSPGGKAFGGNIVPECKHTPGEDDCSARLSPGKADAKDRSCPYTLTLKMPVSAVGVDGKDYELSPECKKQTCIECEITFRLRFDEKLEPSIHVEKSVEKVDMPDVVDGEREEVEANEDGVLAGSKKTTLHLEADPKDEPGAAEPLSDVPQNRESANPKSYHNVREGLRMWCRAARHVYTSTLSHRTAGGNAKVNPALIGELYMEMSAFDDVEDLAADCPNAKKLLDRGVDQLSRRLVRVFKRHGVVMDRATARYAMQIHLNQIREGAGA